jgi:hypothetical protein
MDALEFIASIIGSLAWPGVVLVVLWYNRQRLASLPDWIEELTLPGGTKIKFVRALASAEAKLSASEAPASAQVASVTGRHRSISRSNRGAELHRNRGDAWADGSLPPAADKDQRPGGRSPRPCSLWLYQRE